MRIRDFVGTEAFSFSREQTTSQILQPLQALTSTIKIFFMLSPLWAQHVAPQSASNETRIQ
jgi:hypothetical protein